MEEYNQRDRFDLLGWKIPYQQLPPSSKEERPFKKTKVMSDDCCCVAPLPAAKGQQQLKASLVLELQSLTSAFGIIWPLGSCVPRKYRNCSRSRSSSRKSSRKNGILWEFLKGNGGGYPIPTPLVFFVESN